MKGHVGKYELKNGEVRWLYSHPEGKYPVTGKPKRKLRRAFQTEREALKAMRESIMEYENGLVLLHSNMTLTDYLMRWDESHVSRLKPKTVAFYQSAIYDHLIPNLGHHRLKYLDVEHIQNYVNEVCESERTSRGKRVSPTSIRRRILTLSTAPETCRQAEADQT